MRVKGRRRGRGVTGEPRGSPEGSSATWKTKRGQRCPHTRPLLSSRETPYQPPHLLLHLTPAPPSLRPGPASPRPGLRRPGPLHTTLGPSRQPSRPSSISTRPGLLSARASSHPGLEEKGLLVTRSRSALPAFLPSSALRAPTPRPPGLQRGGETPSPPAHPLPPSSWALRLSPRGLSLLRPGPSPAGSGEAWPPPWLRLLSTKLSPDLPSPLAFLLLGPRGPQPRLTLPSPSSAP